MTRVRCAAQDLLFKTGLDLTALRNTALSYYTSGRMPRRLLLQRELPPGVPRASSGRPVGAPPLPYAPPCGPRSCSRRRSRRRRREPHASVRDLVDDVTDDEVADARNRRPASPRPARVEARRRQPLRAPARHRR